MNSRYVPVLVAVLLSLFGDAQQAFACSCAQQRPACEVAWNATAVFVGRVESITTPPSARGRLSIPGPRRVRFTVLEAFTGPGGSEIDVDTGSGGGDCGYRFQQGREYLVYANMSERTGRLQTGSCSRTRLTSNAGEDLEYLRGAFRDRKPLGRIAGTVLLRERNLARRLDTRKPAAGIAVLIQPASGGDAMKVVTDTDGSFSAEGFPAGGYSLRYELPDTHYGEFFPAPLTLPDARACATAEGVVSYNGRIRGRIVDSSGSPVQGVTVDVTVRAGLQTPEGAERIQAVTGPDGVYEVARLPPGTFIVGLNTAPREGEGQPPRLFHPGVEGLEGATGVRVGAGELESIADLVIPRQFPVVRISGVVLDPDGAPATGARVYLAAGSENSILGEPVPVDAGGRFVMDVFGGLNYQVFAQRDAERRPEASDRTSFTAAPSMPPIQLRLRVRY